MGRVPEFPVGEDQSVTSLDLAGDFEGNFVVAWSTAGFSLGERDILARRYEPPVELQVSDLSVSEGNPQGSAADALVGPPQPATAVYTVFASKDHPNGAPVGVGYETRDGTATSLEVPGVRRDYEPISGTLEFDDSLFQTVEVRIAPDAVFETDETFFLRLLDPVNAVIARNPGTVTIINDDPAGSLRISDVRLPSPAEEGDSDRTGFRFDLELELCGPGAPPDCVPSQEVEASASYLTVDGTATGGEDYETTTGRVTILPGTTRATVSIDVFGDTEVEGHETFSVELFDEENAVLADAAGVGTIQNDDCTGVAVSPSSAEWPAEGGASGEPGNPPDAGVVGAAGCQWTARASDDWIIVSSPTGGAGSGDGPLEYAVGVNNSLTPRSGSIRLADGCVAPDELIVDAPGSIQGIYRACTSLMASEVQVVGPTTLTAGGSVALGEEFSVAAGATLVVEAAEPVPAIEVTQSAVACSFAVSPPEADFGSAAGSGQVSVTASNGICPWTAVSQAPWISITAPNPPSGTGSDLVSYEVAENPGGERSGTLAIAGEEVTVRQEAVFFDHFDDGALAADWTYTAAELWSESGSRLAAGPIGSGQEAQALATPSFAGCDRCTIRSTLRVTRFATGLVTLLGWHQDADNHVALVMDEFADTWTLTQRAGGADVATAASSGLDIQVGQDYAVELSFDGAGFEVLIDGSPAIQMPAGSGGTPFGTGGFHVAGTAADFDLIAIVTH